ncbi:YihY/virulence factor BrkB family protein [Patescibacteria group bacterium]|nr:YihY/virulence factor BrkB family protein [Patescibacteria group bacterium]
MKLIKGLIKDTFNAWLRCSPATTGAALAYYSLFSLPAMLVVIVAITSSIFGAGRLENQLMSQLQSLLGANVTMTIKAIADHSRDSNAGLIAGIISIFTIFIGSIGAFGQLESALNHLWAVPSKLHAGIKGFIREKIISFLMILFIGLLLILSLITSTIIPFFYGIISRLLPYFSEFIELINLLLSFFFLTILFMSIYAFLPRTKVSKPAIFFGSIITTSLFMIGRVFIQAYLNFEFVISAYGAASAIIIVLLWSYYSAQVFLLGAAFTYTIDQWFRKT